MLIIKKISHFLSSLFCFDLAKLSGISWSQFHLNILIVEDNSWRYRGWRRPERLKLETRK